MQTIWWLDDISSQLCVPRVQHSERYASCVYVNNTCSDNFIALYTCYMLYYLVSRVSLWTRAKLYRFNRHSARRGEKSTRYLRRVRVGFASLVVWRGFVCSAKVNWFRHDVVSLDQRQVFFEGFSGSPGKNVAIPPTRGTATIESNAPSKPAIVQLLHNNFYFDSTLNIFIFIFQFYFTFFFFCR